MVHCTRTEDAERRVRKSRRMKKKIIKGHREIILGPGLDEHIAGIALLTIIHAADTMCVCERERIISCQMKPLSHTPNNKIIFRWALE